MPFQRVRAPSEPSSTIEAMDDSTAPPIHLMLFGTGQLREVKGEVEVRAIPHTYSYGTHRTAVRRRVDELLLIAP